MSDHRPLTMAYRPATMLLVLTFALPIHAQTPPSTGSTHGIVVDARDGTPLEKVSVRVQDTKQTTVSGSDGRFQLDAMPAGSHELYVSSVDLF